MTRLKECAYKKCSFGKFYYEKSNFLKLRKKFKKKKHNSIHFDSCTASTGHRSHLLEFPTLKKVKKILLTIIIVYGKQNIK